MKKGKSWVLLADVVGSRSIPNRPAFELTFKKAIEKVNEQYAAAMLLPVKGWKGLDELAALLKTPKPIYAIASLLNSELAPEHMRLSVVQQDLDIIPTDKDIRSADGPAFHEAAAQMLQLKKEGLLFGIKGTDNVLDAQLAVSVNALLMLKANWTERQKAIYTAYCQTENQQTVASQLAISQQTVSKTLITIKASQVQLLEARLQQWLNNQYQ